MAKHRYRVKTVCTATVAEEWTVESDRPLTPDQLEDLIVGGEIDGDDPNTEHVSFNCVEEEVSDEHDRSMTEWSLLDVDEGRGRRRTRVRRLR